MEDRESEIGRNVLRCLQREIADLEKSLSEHSSLGGMALAIGKIAGLKQAIKIVVREFKFEEHGNID